VEVDGEVPVEALLRFALWRDSEEDVRRDVSIISVNSD
jgi:hypothetical protein